VNSNRFRFPHSGDAIGAHLSTKGGLPSVFARAETVSASAVALFSRNSNQWKARDLTEEECAAFAGERERTGVQPVLAHTTYLINLATTNPLFYEKSIDGMLVELTRAQRLGMYAVVLHPGAHMGAGISAGVDQIARSFDRIHALLPDSGVITLLETSAGQGSCLGCSFEELGNMLRLIDDRSRMGVCFDTCHVFASGYDIRTRDGYERTIEDLDRHVGIANVGAFHLNDSKKPLGSRVDRHQHIGEGEIGLDAFAFLLNDPRFAGIPKLIETPKPHPFESDIRNLTTLRSLVSRSTNVGPGRKPIRNMPGIQDGPAFPEKGEHREKDNRNPDRGRGADRGGSSSDLGGTPRRSRPSGTALRRGPAGQAGRVEGGAGTDRTTDRKAPGDRVVGARRKRR
jgi:deoxyribonuclease-4